MIYPFLLVWLQDLPTNQPTIFMLVLVIPQLILYLLLMRRVEYFYGLYTAWVPLMYYFVLVWLTVLQLQGQPLLENQLPIGILGGLISMGLIVLGAVLRGRAFYNTTVPIKLLQLFPWCIVVSGVVWALLLIYRFDI